MPSPSPNAPRRLRSGLLWPVMAFVSVAVFATPTPSIHAATPCWRPPVLGWVVDPFREPPCPWCAGNRGIEFGLAGRQTVRAVAAGTVTYAGSIAGTRYVVVEHTDGWKVTYGRLDSVLVERHDRVARGAVVGRARLEFFFGLRVDDVYRDPAPYLGTEHGTPRLVPLDGRRPRPAPPSTWKC